MTPHLTIYQHNNYQPNPNKPIALITHNPTTNTLTIHATKQFTQTWTPYLTNPKTLQKHGTQNLLKNITKNMTMLPHQYNETHHHHQQTLKKLKQNNPTTTTTTIQLPQP